MSHTSEKVVSFHGRRTAKSAKDTVLGAAANELVFAVVGHVGSGTTQIAEILESLLRDKSAIGETYDVSCLKATDIIAEWAKKKGQSIPARNAHGKKTIKYVTDFQNLGDAMRRESNDHTAVAKGLIIRIRQERAAKRKVTPEAGTAVDPDGTPRAYVLDSIRHPAEVQLLRHIYQDAFVLIGVVCESETRAERVAKKYADAGQDQVAELMQRDEKDLAKHGQRVADAFHLADFFVDNTPSRFKKENKKENPEWEVPEKLSRLIKIIRQKDVERPLSGETAMWHAHGAAMRSACLSRQVGAALVDRDGNVVATGTNEVPRAGGGVYGEGFSDSAEDTDPEDHRCAYREVEGRPPFCSNTKEQGAIVRQLLTDMSKIKPFADDSEREKVSELFRKGRIGELLEFSRAVHAEMDAILTAGRKAISTLGTRLFVTTFPCHYCARHIVTAGIDEVQYIEPYPKSQALRLHDDSIQITAEGWALPSSERLASGLPNRMQQVSKVEPRVLFRPFTGVAPRLYRRAFLKEAELKNSIGDREVGDPEWGSPWHLRRLSYAEIEAELAAAADT